MNDQHTPFEYIENETFLEELEKRYEFEDKVYIAVSHGLPQLVPAIFDDFVNRPSDKSKKYIFNDFMATAKLFCNNLNLTGRIAARSCGLQSIDLHRISQKFRIIIDETDDAMFLIQHLPKEIITHYATAVADLSTRTYSPLVIKTIQYISSHITEPIGASDIASALYVSSAHLSRKFKADTGKNIPDYINTKRISIAKILLLRNAKNITEVALQVGYHDSSYFSKAFKKVEGITPTQYLNQLKFIKT